MPPPCPSPSGVASASAADVTVPSPFGSAEGVMCPFGGREQQAWEASDGAVHLLRVLSQVAPAQVAQFLPTVSELRLSALLSIENACGGAACGSMPRALSLCSTPRPLTSCTYTTMGARLIGIIIPAGPQLPHPPFGAKQPLPTCA